MFRCICRQRNICHVQNTAHAVFAAITFHKAPVRCQRRLLASAVLQGCVADVSTKEGRSDLMAKVNSLLLQDVVSKANWRGSQISNPFALLGERGVRLKARHSGYVLQVSKFGMLSNQVS